MKRWNNVTYEWLEVDRGRQNKRTRGHVCASANVKTFVQMGCVCVCVCLSRPHHYKAHTFVFGLITTKHTRKSRAA